jgi:hypothetical protein
MKKFKRMGKEVRNTVESQLDKCDACEMGETCPLRDIYARMSEVCRESPRLSDIDYEAAMILIGDNMRQVDTLAKCAVM